jgi:hypothetical protein
MSAQRAPHTPPLWRRVLSLPQTRLGWWAIGLAVTFVVLLIFGVVVFENEKNVKDSNLKPVMLR